MLGQALYGISVAFPCLSQSYMDESRPRPTLLLSYLTPSSPPCPLHHCVTLLRERACTGTPGGPVSISGGG